MKEKTIYTKRLAYALRCQGFEIIRVEINPNKPQFDCWVFEDTPAFRAAFIKLTNK